jgi:acetate kinase
MKILVINTGSSSIKYQLFEMEDHRVLASGLLEKIGESTSRLSHKTKELDEPILIEKQIADHKIGMEEIDTLLTDPKVGVIKKSSELKAIGHRVVHGGEAFHEPTLITDEVISAIKEHTPLAPLHNPANLTGIESAISLFKGVPQIAVFDTAFHQSLPAHAFRYALPNEYYEKLKVRRYGFHGTSHLFVSKAAAELLGKGLDNLNLITAHLGNGASIAAVKNGKSVDTSMGMTPLEGLIMGTRSGDIDPAIHFYLAEHSNLEFMEINKVLNKQSGLKGLVGINDMRDIFQKMTEGDPKAALAVEMYAYRIKKYIGAYYAALGSVDAIVFTAGIGENSPQIRELALNSMQSLGIEIDKEKNDIKEKRAREIQSENSKIKILVIPTNEELEIAIQSAEVISN